MSRCEFAAQASADLIQIHDYIAQDSPVNALRFIERLERQCYHLADHPELGRLRPEFGLNIRTFLVPRTRYILFYRAVEDGVQILHVRQGSRDLRRLFQ
ncbi:MAG: type II toxin-antitoxin system RelE/ParE family toxin [SAR202 cluster bacterium]|nr:type II toxin-antitoxin system RelE/ParE family toxin [SAR202 cluster bacterium]